MALGTGLVLVGLPSLAQCAHILIPVEVGYKVSIVAFDNGSPVAPANSNTSATDIFANADNSKCPDSCLRYVPYLRAGRRSLALSYLPSMLTEAGLLGLPSITRDECSYLRTLLARSMWLLKTKQQWLRLAPQPALLQPRPRPPLRRKDSPFPTYAFSS